MSDENVIIYKARDGRTEIALTKISDKVWLSQSDIAKLFGTSVANISMHIKNILNDKELNEMSTIKKYLRVAIEGGREVQREETIYSLEMILSIGFRVRSKRAVEFRQWALRNLITYLEKGFLINEERLKNPNMFGALDYFDELLEKIRDIRASEKRFYQKVRDLFSLSYGYDPNDKATQMFFAEVQNKLLYAVTLQTAADIIVARADPQKPNMNSYIMERLYCTQGRYLSCKELFNSGRNRDFKSSCKHILRFCRAKSKASTNNNNGLLEGIR